MNRKSVAKELVKLAKTLIGSRYSRTAETELQEEAILVIEKWLKNMGKQVSGGTTIGKSPQTVILDIKYQDNAISVKSEGFEDKVSEHGSRYNGVEVYGVHIPDENSFALFKKTIEDRLVKKEAKEDLFKNDKNWRFPKGTRVTVDLSSAGEGPEDLGMTQKEFDKFIKHDGQTAKVTNLEVETEPNPKSKFNYYRVRFSDGYDIQISAQMLEKE